MMAAIELRLAEWCVSFRQPILDVEPFLHNGWTFHAACMYYEITQDRITDGRLPGDPIDRCPRCQECCTIPWRETSPEVGKTVIALDMR